MSDRVEGEVWKVAGHEFRSRLIIGSGKYETFEQNLECATVSGAEMITVALRRVNLDAAKGPRLLDVISPDRFTILPNTAGCYSAEDALTTARMGRELLETDLVKLEVIGDPKTLFPDNLCSTVIIDLCNRATRRHDSFLHAVVFFSFEYKKTFTT